MALLRITNTARDYAWGDLELIPELLGQEPSGKPQAEIWFGTHPGSPATVLDDENGTLTERVGELGFLVKLLAAARPLSIQAHPTKEHAAMRFAEGHPGYADANHKPELIAAISEFRALCGFRAVGEIAADLERLVAQDSRFAPWLTSLATSGLRGATDWALAQQGEIVAGVVSAAGVLGPERQALVIELEQTCSLDVGILVALLMNLVELQPGEALFLPAGNIHAYLSGLGVEVMAASDNVLRGGLTQKAIDIPELMQVLDFSELTEPRVKPREIARGLTEYPVTVSDFQVFKVEPSGANMLIDLLLRGRAILVCIAGELSISTSQEQTLALRRGQACYLDSANYFSILGSGTGYLAMG